MPTTYLEAIREGLWEEMERDPNVFLLGEDIGVYGGAFKVTAGFIEHFGEKRVVDTPISPKDRASICASSIRPRAGKRFRCRSRAFKRRLRRPSSGASRHLLPATRGEGNAHPFAPLLRGEGGRRSRTPDECFAFALG